MFIFITSLSALISGIFVVGLGFFIFYKDRRSSLNRIFFVMSLAIGIWLVGTYKMLTSQADGNAIFWDRFIYAAVVFIPVLMYHFSWVFTKLGKKKAGLIIGYVLSSFFLLLSRTDLFVSGLFYYKWGVHTQARLFHHVFLLFFFVYLFLTLRIFYIYYRKGALGNTQKAQAKYVFIAFFVLIVVGSTAYAPAYKIDIPPFSFLSGLIFTLILSYAIIRHRLLDIRLFVVRSILYSFTVILVGGLFTMVVFTLGEQILGSTFWGIIIGSVAISLGLEPLLHFLRRVTDRYFFQEKYNYQKTMQELAQSMTRIIDLQKLLDTTTATIKSALKVERIAVILWNGEGDLPIEVKQVGFDVPLDTHFSRKKNLVQHLARTQDELVEGELRIEMERGRLEIPTIKAESIVREMRNLDIAVCFPIISNDNLIGVLALGNKQSGDVFSNDDIKMLNIFSWQAGIAIVNAQLYREVKDFNITLQEEIALATEDLRKKNDELHRANVKLKELDQAKSDFLSLASHQLRAPLSITKGYVSMIMEGTYGPCPPEMIEPLEMVYNGNERLVKFVNNLLDVSRMESGRLEYIFKDVNLAEMAESVTKELKLAADKKNIYLKAEIDKSIPRVKADDEKLRQVVMNLIDNAIKYTKTGGVSVSLKKGKNKKNEEGIVFSVTDTGRGMDENDKVSLFQKFSRGKGISRVHTEGTGLGLFVAAKIIDAHKGTIWADSPGNDQGSMFAFWMPAGE